MKIGSCHAFDNGQLMVGKRADRQYKMLCVFGKEGGKETFEEVSV